MKYPPMKNPFTDSYVSGFRLFQSLFNHEGIPATPIHANFETSGMLPQTDILKAKASMFGQMIGYIQEQNGLTIHNLVPNKKTEYQQISSSSKAQLELHTELAFHPYRPDYVLLMCLRGDIEAKTTVATLGDIMRNVDAATERVLRQPLFITSLDVSFQNEGQSDTLITTAILVDDSIVYDGTLMTGTTPEAKHAMEHLNYAINLATRKIALITGDLLVIDNKTCIHGRAPFEPRYDGTDRWIQRALVRKLLPAQEHRNGNIITTKL